LPRLQAAGRLMGSVQDRIDREWELQDARWDAHEAGDHPIPDLDCARCQKDLREAVQCDGYAGDPGASAPRCESYRGHPGGHFIRPPAYHPPDGHNLGRGDWTEDAEGFVRAPLSYENREGDPAFNGALDKW
jgi:hypothetical protein